MKDLSRNGYTSDEIMDALRGKTGSRHIDFRYDLLDENENKIDEIYEIISAKVEMAALSDIKRTATFSLREEIVIDRTLIERKLNELPESLREW